MGKKAKLTEGYKALGPMPEDGPPAAKASKADEERARKAARKEEKPGKDESVEEPAKPVRRRIAKDDGDAWASICGAAAQQCEELLERNKEAIEAAYNQAIEEIDDDKKQYYGVGLSIKITGDDPKHYTVRTKISFAVKTTDSAEDQVSIGKDLVDMMD